MQNKDLFIFLADGYKGGANTFLFHQMQYLTKKKQKVLLIDKNPSETFPKIDNKIKVIKIDIFREKNKKILLFENILKSYNKSKKFIIFTNFFIYIKYFFFFRKLQNYQSKIILTLHSGILEMTLIRFLASLIFSFIYSSIDYIIFGSNSAKFWWKDRFPWMNIIKAPVHYNGVKVNKKNNAKKIKKKLQISFVGRLEKENNPNFFIQIALEYLKNKKNVIFNIYGNGSLLNELKSKYSSQNIIFHGWVEQKKIYDKTNLIIITSPINNYPYVALEAKSFGIPVISCSKGDIKKIIYNGIDGFISYTNSTKKIIYLIDKIKNDYRKFSFNSLKKSQKFELNKSCKCFWQLIND